MQGKDEKIRLCQLTNPHLVRLKLESSRQKVRRFSKNVGLFPKNVGDFLKNVGVFFKNVGDFFFALALHLVERRRNDEERLDFQYQFSKAQWLTSHL